MAESKVGGWEFGPSTIFSLECELAHTLRSLIVSTWKFRATGATRHVLAPMPCHDGKISGDQPPIREETMRGVSMNTLSRRSALILAATTAAMPKSVEAQPYGPNEGVERAPGVREIRLSEKSSKVPSFKTVMLRDIVYQPGSKTPNSTMKNAMICHCVEGELQVTQEDGAFTAKKGTIWTCKEGGTETSENKGNTVAIMRVIDLMT
jgi:quercetin dioxygenase-like cupin family protein